MKGDRREFLAATGAILLAGRAAAQKPSEKPVTPDHITPDAQKAIDRGLAYLARAQAGDGSYGDGPPFQGNVAITALAGLAFMAGGHQPGRGVYGKNVTRAMQYVLSQESNQTPGFLYRPVDSRHGPMYSHGFGTLFLAELHGMVDDNVEAKRLRATLDRAVQLIISCQNIEGGWRYRPIPEQADVSVTICQIMALRSARNAGLAVPKSSADRCIEYVKACQTNDGGFRYQKQGGGSAFARSAAGLCALYSAGLYKGEVIDKALAYLVREMKNGSHGNRRADTHFYYGFYYAAQAIWTAGEPYWSDWFPVIRDDLVLPGREKPDGRQRSDGAWIDPNFHSDYATAMALIILQIPNNYLPILQK